MERRNVCIVVAAHKAYRMPEDPAYLPVQVGAALNPAVHLGYQRDDEGMNISTLNRSYSELTAMYWVWKNVEADVKGLVHYRRLLGSLDCSRKRAKDPFARVVTGEELTDLIDVADVVLPKKRNYFIETVQSHYAHTHTPDHLDVCRDVLLEFCPEYVSAWDSHMNSTHLHICNMCAMRGELFDKYCAWMFPILGEISARVDNDRMTDFEIRWPGRISELLIDPWIEKNGIRFTELPIVSPEPVDWMAKGKGFLAAKFLGKKYEKSF